MPNTQKLVSELAPTVLAGLEGDDRARGDELLAELCRDWVREAGSSGKADDVLAILRDDLARATGGLGPRERLAVLEAEVLDRRLRVLSRQSLALGKEVVDRAVDDATARERGKALLEKAEALSPEIDAIAATDRRPALRRQLEEIVLEALYAVERKAMSARLDRYARDQQGADSAQQGADQPGPPKITP